MAHVDFTIAALFNKLFPKAGEFEPVFPLVVNESDKTDEGLLRKSYGNVASSPMYAKDPALGVEYYLPVTISFPVEDAVGTVNGQGRLESWDLPFPIISIRSQKTIVETTMTERTGTVKEQINIQDYQIVVRGMMIGKTKEFPETGLQKLVSLYELNVPVRISNVVTDIFLVRPDRSGSDYAVITSITFPEVRGAKNVRGYEITMMSDEPFNLIDIGE